VDLHCITTTKIHENLALCPSRYSDEIVAVSQNALTVIKVKHKQNAEHNCIRHLWSEAIAANCNQNIVTFRTYRC